MVNNVAILAKYGTLLAILVIGFNFMSCNHKLEKDNYIGPELIAMPADFKILDTFSVSNEPLDFANRVENFKANFSHRVSWEINVTGLSSGAVKKITGTSQQIDLSNGAWNGNSDNIYFFSTDDKCYTTLSFYGTNYVVVDTFSILSAKLLDGILISNFDGLGMLPAWSYTPKPNELSYFSDAYDSIKTVQGTKCLHISGVDKSPDGFLGIAYNNGDLTTGLLASNPSKIYFNCYVRGIPNTRLEIRLVEHDGDEYSSFVTFGNEEWKLVSFRYDYFVLSTGQRINGFNPDNLKDIKFALRADPYGSAAEVNIDTIIFTEDRPFKQ